MKNKVVILIISHKSELNIYEQISLKQCYKVLGQYSIKIICPKGLDVSLYKTILPNPEFDFIEPVWQATYANFNRLKIEPFLYERYKKFQFVLFYEPDAFVFRDELEYWCNQGYDYIGAPWFEDCLSAEDGNKLWRVGNGGFSLRNVEKHLKMLSYLKYIELAERYSQLNWKNNLWNFLRLINTINSTYQRQSSYFADNFKFNEDGFWSIYSKDYIDKFNAINNDILSRIIKKIFSFEFYIPNPDLALKFSFENSPGFLHVLNNNQLPFGCHAWYKYDYEFWKPFITAEGYKLP